MAHLLGIDIGTTTIKSVAIDAADGRVLAAAEQEHPLARPQPGYAEQNPDDWWETAVHTTRAVLADPAVEPAVVAGIGLSGQMHGGALIGADARPLRPAIIWPDTRSSPQVDDLRTRVTVAQMAQHAPGLPAAGYMAPTLMWLAQHEPHTLADLHAFLIPKDYVRLRLTGQIATDPTDAAATWLFDTARGIWSDWLVDLCGLDDRCLPPVIPSGAVAGRVTTAAAEALGLPAGVPVIAGCADMPAQALGCGLTGPGRALLICGTGGQVFHARTTPHVDPALRYYVYNHALPGRWYAQAAILSAGLSLRWLRDTLHAGDYARLSALAAAVPPGAEGLVFLPYLAGERTPLMDPAASGLFLGLRLHHGPGHLARAVMEGVTFALAECRDLVAAEAAIIASGGATRSALWRQIMADGLDTPLLLPAGAHHACVGTALLAGVGVGLYADLPEALARLPEPEVAVTPHAPTAAFYQERRALFRGLYGRLKDDMHALGASG